MKLHLRKALYFYWKPWLSLRYLDGRRLWWLWWGLEWRTNRYSSQAPYLDVGRQPTGRLGRRVSK